MVKVGNNTFTLLILNTRAPHGCVLSPLMYSLLTHDCEATPASNSIIKFADDTTVVGMITNNDETAYRGKVRAWESGARKITSLNIKKTKELIMDFRKQQREHAPVRIDGITVEKVERFKVPRRTHH